MPHLDLKYGQTTIPFVYPEGSFDILAPRGSGLPLTDVEIGQRLDSPVGSPVVEEIVRPGESVLIAVPDATRQTASGQVVNLLVRRLIANGTSPSDINIIFATGIHRPVTEAEKQAILTPFIAQRIKTLDHDARNPLRSFHVGETTAGIPVELNWRLTEADHIILVGGISFHYFAGFTGGRKLVCPGLASAKTISETHKLAFDCDSRSRRGGVGPGLLDGNAVHEAFVEAVGMVNPSFAINTIVNDAGEAVDVICGDWNASHRAGCEIYAGSHTVEIPERRPLVVASCGGYPFDINMIQAHKALDCAAMACEDGGMIVLLAECPDGTGRDDFLSWFDSASDRDLAEKLCENYQVSGQTAWSLLEKTERFDVRILTTLDDAAVSKMRMARITDLADTTADVPNGKGYLIPSAAKVRIVAGGSAERSS